MSQLLDKSEVRSGGRDHERLFDTGDRRTLDDVVTRLSQTLTVSWNAGCLVCGASFIRAAGARPPPPASARLRQHLRVANRKNAPMPGAPSPTEAPRSPVTHG